MGLSGEVIHTPGHSDDSISVFLDSGDAFIGDLQPEYQIMEDDIISKSSWLRLKKLGVKKLGVKCVNPGHGHSFEV